MSMPQSKPYPIRGNEGEEDEPFDQISHQEIMIGGETRTFDVFLSHNWGKDIAGRDNHARVTRLARGLNSKGIKPWCDEYNMEGNIFESMAEGIDKSRKTIVFVTEEYIKKANGKGKNGTMDNVYREFNYINNHVSLHNIIVVVMEESVRDMTTWRGTFGLKLAGQLYIDFSKESSLSRCIKHIKKSFHRPPPGKKIHEITYPDGSVYEGLVKHDMNFKLLRHGYGKLTDAYGNIYEGKFKEDKKDDKLASILYPQSGAKFEGRFENDQRYPMGTLTLEDGTVIKGRIAGSKKVGTFDGDNVTVTFAKSENKYVGAIKANTMEGNGRMEFQDGDVYNGSWKGGVRDGTGEMKYSNGDVYSGRWENNMRHGYGKLVLADHDIYEGEFRNDMIHGKGKYLAANGAKYEGDFVQNKRCGKGILTLDNNRVTCGEWKDDKLHGRGYREFSNGDRYYGIFKDSKRHGEGEMLFASGGHYSGQWREGKMRRGTFDFSETKRRMGGFGLNGLFKLTKLVILFKPDSSNEVQQWNGLSSWNNRRTIRSDRPSSKSSKPIFSFTNPDNFCKPYMVPKDAGSVKKTAKVLIKVSKKPEAKKQPLNGSVETASPTETIVLSSTQGTPHWTHDKHETKNEDLKLTLLFPTAPNTPPLLLPAAPNTSLFTTKNNKLLPYTKFSDLPTRKQDGIPEFINIVPNTIDL